MAFIGVEDDLPPADQFVAAYSEPFGVYEIVRFCPARGWVNQANRQVSVITHWDNAGIFLPFPILEIGEYNEDSLEKYKIEKP